MTPPETQSRDESRAPSGARKRRWVLLAGGSLLFIGLVALSVWYRVTVEWYRMPTVDMEPTIKRGDRFAVERISEPEAVEFEPGVVVIFVSPHDDSTLFTKRVVGVAGDSLRWEGSALYRNGVKVDEPYVERQSGKESPERLDGWLEGETLVPEGHVFVTGDNRARSHDSRYFGAIPKTSIRGRFLFVSPW